MSRPVHACFIVDDLPANATWWMRHQQEAFGYVVPDRGWGKGWRELAAAPKFRIEDAAALADLVETFGLRGKCTLLPCPAGLGRIDRSVRLYADDELAELLGILRVRIAPSFDITPEVLTHAMAYDVDSGAMLPHTETAYLSHLAAEGKLVELVAYLRTAYIILHNAGFRPHGMTLGAMADPSGIAGGRGLLAGQGREIFGEAVLRVERQFEPALDTSFMFTGSPPVSEASRTRLAPEVVYDGAFGRAFEIHSLQDPAHPAMHGRATAGEVVDRLITADGAAGAWVQHIESGALFVVTTHAQTLNSLNTGQGLAILREAFTRLARRYGSRLLWHTTRELCQTEGWPPQADR
ncbi:MAG: hypothetical protein GX591_13575 [Planctomycetes bacterium]|nr:hypothetical protein [Planctomycetota bacterium]